jgi:hypothetical protein
MFRQENIDSQPTRGDWRQLAARQPVKPMERASAEPPKRRVLVHGDVHAGTVFAQLMDGDGWRFRYYPDAGLRNLSQIARELRTCDIAYQIGGRVSAGKFLLAAKLMRKRKIVMHWTGSDVLDEQLKGLPSTADPWILENVEHWAVSDWLVREAATLGVSCRLVPLPSPSVPDRPSAALPSRFSVLVYMPAVIRGALYGLDRILEVARELPHIPFELVGLLEGTIENPPDNLRVHGRILDLREFFERATVVWRPVRHDGLSWMVLEALGHGRHVLWSYAFPGCTQVRSAADARDEIARLHALDQQKLLQLNSSGVAAIAEGGYLPSHLRGKIRMRLEEILGAQ